MGLRKWMQSKAHKLASGLAVNADAALALQSSTEAVTAILKRREEMDLAGRQDEPLIVLAGEKHDSPLTQAWYIAVLKGIKESEPSVAVALEAQHNISAKVFSSVRNIEVSEETQRQIRSVDQDGRISLKSHFMLSSPHCDFSYKVFKNFLLAEEIPTRNADMSIVMKGNEPILDVSDALTAESLEAENISEDVSAKSTRGVRLRNEFMVTQAIEHCSIHQPRILFHVCGAAHVAGNNTILDQTHEVSPYEDSLSAILKDKGFDVLAMFPDPSVQVIIPENHGLESREICNLPLTGNKVRSNYPMGEGAQPTLIYSDKVINLPSHDFEEPYINGVLAGMDMEDAQMTHEELRKHKSEYFFQIGIGRAAEWDNEPNVRPSPVSGNSGGPAVG